MRLNNDGGMVYCRWADKTQTQARLQDQTPQEFFQTTMQPIRESLLQGSAVPGCAACYQMEQHHKVSGRQRQLLKIGVTLDKFEKTLSSSPWIPIFQQSSFEQLPQDWQIDLGNYCNSACVFCSPASSSRLASEHLQLGLISQLPAPNWTDDPVLLQKFLDTLAQSPHIQYLHFIGGETLIIPAFAKILQALINAGLNQTATIGFTTNLTVWPQSVIDLLCEFPQVNVGMSVEAFAAINDYVRWPSDHVDVHRIFGRWVELSQRQHWLMQLRTTPTVLTLLDLLSVYDQAWQHKVSVESCNFMQNPAFLKPSVLPVDLRSTLIHQWQSWLDAHPVDSGTVVNTRNPDFASVQIHQDLSSYVQYLANEPDESHRLPDLVRYLKTLESVRGNSILSYRPEYEELFRTAGY